MKTTEAISRIESLDFVGRVELPSEHNAINSFVVYDEDDWVYMSVSIDHEFLITRQFSTFNYLTYEQKERIMEIVIEYIRTPIEER